MTNRSQIRLIMGIIRPEHSELFALELEKIAEFDFVYTLASTNINQSSPNLVEMYVTIRSWMSYTIDLIRIEHLELSSLELEKNAIFDFVYNPVSANIDQLAPNLLTIYITNRSQISLIMGIIGLEHSELIALELEKLLQLTSFTL